MGQQTGGFRFPEEPFLDFFHHIVFEFGEAYGLDSHSTADFGVFPFVNNTHGPPPQFSHHFIPAQGWLGIRGLEGGSDITRMCCTRRPKDHGRFRTFELGHSFLQISKVLPILRNEIVSGEGLGELSFSLEIQPESV